LPISNIADDKPFPLSAVLSNFGYFI